MAVPKRKTSKSKNKMRQAGKGLVKKTNLVFDENGVARMFHNTVKLKREKKQKETSNEAEKE